METWIAQYANVIPVGTMSLVVALFAFFIIVDRWMTRKRRRK